MQKYGETTVTDYILFKDISFAKGAALKEEDYEEALACWKGWMDAVPAGMALYEWTADGSKSIYYNREAARLFGDKSDNAEHYFVPQDYIYAEDMQNSFEKMKTALELNKIVESEFRINHADGSHPWLHLRAERVNCFKGHDVVVAVLVDVTTNKEAEKSANELAQKFKYLSEHDELTGLYNRAGFYQKTQEMLAKNPGIDFVMIRWDAEHFKLVNEMSGYEAGNRLLLRASDMLKRFIGAYGIGVAGRFGADHFMACFPLEMLDMQSTFKRINNGLKEMNLDCELKIYAGIYVIQDVHEPVDSMCDKATLALASVKGRYMEPYAYYTTKMLNGMLKEQEVKNDMQHALSEEQFKIYIQPKYDVNSGQIIGGEALVRWIHPEKGYIYPGDFIPFFEKCGFIFNMDQYIWEQVVSYLHESFENGKKVLPLSVNVSRDEFYRENLYAHFNSLVEKYGLSKKYLELEVTESAYAASEDVIYDTLEQLQGAGFSILIDDFGSGYSSFNMMKDAPVDLLKLDMVFLQGIDKNGRGKTIIKHVVSLSKELMIPVIAEGVETQEQVDFLRDIGCDFAQGYFYSKPIPLEEYDRLVQEER